MASRFSRRSFLEASATLPVGLLLGQGAVRAEPAPVRSGKADLVVSGGRLLTMDPSRPVAEAMAVRGDRILAVGSIADVESLVGPATTRVDARDHTVTPGFIDAHSHPLLFSEAIGVNVGLPSIAEVERALAHKAAATPPGHWVVGIMYDDTKFVEQRPLNRLDVDAAVPDHPVIVRHRGGHTAVINSRAFEIAGITFDTPDPVGGTYYRESGAFTGKIAELAIAPLQKFGVWPVEDRDSRSRNAALVSRRMAAAGLTSTTDAMGRRDAFIAYQDARAAGALSIRVSFMPAADDAIFAGLKAAGIRSGFGDDVIRIGAVKYVADGSASERTMRMSTAYQARPDDFGILRMDQKQIDEAVDDAIAHDFRIGIHANGDVTIDMVLSAYERVLKDWKGVNPRLRIEHCSLINPRIVARIKAAGVVPTPFYTYAYYHGEKWAEYGADKMNWMFGHRSFLDAGIPVAPASDFTPGPFEPMLALQSLVTRKDAAGRVWGARQRITVDEALQVCTLNGAYASFEESVKGSLTAGRLADFVVLEHDPHDVDPDRIKDIRILRTVLGGRTTYEA
jgi:hypothetical protein